MKVLLATDGSEYFRVGPSSLNCDGTPPGDRSSASYTWSNFGLSSFKLRSGTVSIPTHGGQHGPGRRKLIARAARTLENAGFSVTTAIKEGDPRTELIDAASEWHADLIMVGSHGRTGLGPASHGKRFGSGGAPRALLSANRAYRQVLRSREILVSVVIYSERSENPGGLKGSTQHWPAVYPPEFEIPRFVVAGY